MCYKDNRRTVPTARRAGGHKTAGTEAKMVPISEAIQKFETSERCNWH